MDVLSSTLTEHKNVAGALPGLSAMIYVADLSVLARLVPIWIASSGECLCFENSATHGAWLHNSRLQNR